MTYTSPSALQKMSTPGSLIDMSEEKDKKKRPKDKPVSLAPLEFEEAVEDLLKVKPKEGEPSEDK